MKKSVYTMSLIGCLFIFSSAQNEISPNKINNSENNQTNTDSLKLTQTIALIVNKKSLNGEVENDSYGEMAYNVYELVYNQSNAIDQNQKMELLILMMYFQEHYLSAYWSVVLTNPNKYDISASKKLNYLFSPFKNCPTSFAEPKPDSTFTNKISIENKAFLEKTDSLLKTNGDRMEYKYRSMMRRLIYSPTFYNRYNGYFGD
jgi:hypothetical protein